MNFLQQGTWIQVLLLLQISSGILFCQGAVDEKPNFLIILVDDLGAQDVGCYGQEYMETPAIDGLAREGLRWTNAYSSCPVCSPSRAALLTGKSTARVHFTGHITAIEKHRHPENSRIIPPEDLMYIPTEEILISEALKPAGYTSINIGKWHVGGPGYWPLDQGFDYNVAGWTHGSPPGYFFPYKNPDKKWNSHIPTLKGGREGEYLTDRLTDEAIRFLEDHGDKPFLLYLPHYGVHTPLEAPQALIDKYIPIVRGTNIDPTYAAMVENMDWNIGRVLDRLKALKLDENTVVIFASDNGGLSDVTDNKPFREGKGHLYEGGIRVPYIMRWPGHIPPGITSSRPTISEDIYATILDIAGAGVINKSDVDGVSLMNEIRGNRSDSARDLFWYYPHYVGHAMQPGAAVRSGDYKLIEFYDPPRVELYNLTTDVGEQIDLSETMSEKKEKLLEKLHAWLKDSGTIMHTHNPNFEE